MHSSILLLIASFVYLFLILCLFSIKEKQRTMENKIYFLLLIVTIIGVIVDMCGIYAHVNLAENSIIRWLVVKIYLLFLLTFIYLVTIYIMFVGNNQEKKNSIVKTKPLIIVTTLYGISFILNFILPFDYYKDGNVIYVYGLNCIYLYALAAIAMVGWLLYIFLKRKTIKKTKVLPMMLFTFLGIPVVFIQFNNPEFLLVTAMCAFLTVFMYHTIENPDMKMIEKLEVAKTTAEKANRAKSDFLSSMSHEIRTPLNAIVGFSECIKSADSLEEAKDNANDVVTASQTLLEIVNGILDISKIESGKLELVESDYDTHKLFKEVEKLIIARLGDKELDFKVNIAEDLPDALYGDHFNIKKILINLLTNAVKYTDEGYVLLNVKCVNNNDICRLIVSVKDSGRGIKKENIDKLFTKFNRLDEDRNTTIEGTGLGLAITKQLVDMMGGKIVVNSVYGEGSEFTVAIDQKISNKVIEKEVEETVDFVDLSGKKILLVDDNKLNLKVAQKLLMPYKVVIDVCENGFECLDKINLGNQYDLILMDDMMPKLKGPEVLNKLKEIPDFKTPVIALTANAINGIREQYINMGFNDYLAKPIDKQDLNTILSKFLANNTKKEEKVEEKMVDTSNKKIMIVDDNKLNIKIATQAMKDYNFNITEAYSGSDCLEKVKTEQYDLIFMDYMMPEMDGIETLHKLKELPNFKTPVIALTADAVEGSREKFLAAGFDDYVAKPINKGMLNDSIINVIEKNIMNKEVPNKGNITYLKQNGIDVDSGLSVLGNIELYNDTLTCFAETMKERVVKLENWKQQNNMHNYAIEVNALKSDCNYLGFSNLLKITTIHENKARENDIDYVNNNYDELLNELKRLMVVIKEYL